MKRLGCVLPSRPNHIKELGSALNVDPLCILHRMPSPKFMFKTIWWTSNHVPRQRLLQYCPGASKQGLYATILHMYAPLIDSSVGKESTCNAGDPSSIPRSGRSTPVFLGFPCGSASKESTSNVGDLGSIPGLGRSFGEGKGYPLQYSGLENSMDCIVHRLTKSWTQLSNFH